METVRTTRNTFETFKAKLVNKIDLISRIEAGAKIRAQEVAFTIEPNGADAQEIAASLASHGEGGRMGQALDRIRAVCLGQSATKVEVTETTESDRVAEVSTESVKEPVTVVSAPINDAQTEAKEAASAFAATNFSSWREQFGKLYADGTLAPDGKKKA